MFDVIGVLGSIIGVILYFAIGVRLGKAFHTMSCASCNYHYSFVTRLVCFPGVTIRNFGWWGGLIPRSEVKGDYISYAMYSMYVALGSTKIENVYVALCSFFWLPKLICNVVVLMMLCLATIVVEIVALVWDCGIRVLLRGAILAGRVFVFLFIPQETIRE